MPKFHPIIFLIPFILAALACDPVTQATPLTQVITLPASLTPVASPASSLTSTSATRTTAHLTATPTNTAIIQTATLRPTFSPTQTTTFTLAAPTFTPTSTSVPPTATSTFAPTQPPPTFTATTAPATTTNAQASCQTQSNETLEDQLIALINVERSARGVGPLAEQGQLTTAARGHSADMACNDFFGHSGSNGSGLGQRLSAQGYGYSAAGENIGAGYPSAQEMFDGWMQSDGHREAMLNPGYTQVGVGYVFHAGDQYGHYWTADFGVP